ncbi:MAG: hypothetical protein U1E86_28355 [Burkholderiaceae bacterium]
MITALAANTRSAVPKSSTTGGVMVFAPVTVHGLPVQRSVATVARAGVAAARATTQARTAGIERVKGKH